MLILGALSATAAVGTGLYGEERVMVSCSVREHLLEPHKKFMVSTPGLSIVLTAWAMASRPFPNFRRGLISASLIIFLATFLFSSCAAIREWAEKPPPETPELLAQGKTLYENNCVQCHGPNGDGKGWKAAELKKKPRNFTLSFEQWNYSKGEPKKIFEVLKVGIPDTPMAMFHFTDEQRWALVYRVMEFSKGNEVTR